MRRLGFILVGACAAATLATAQTVRTETVLPTATDAQISGWLGAHLVAISPEVESRQFLFVYLHGQGGTGTGASELLKTAAQLGYHAIGLTYPNDWSPFNLCAGDPACPEAMRLEIFDGQDRTSLVNISTANSIENRLTKLVEHLATVHPTEGWADFLPQGQIAWDRIVLWGHSMGGGNAAVIARNRLVARVCLSAPAADGGPGNPAAWWASHLTPSDRYFGFCHTQDALSSKVAFWDALGMGAFGAVTDVAAGSPPFGQTHELSTSVAPAVAGQFHNSVVADGVTPRDAQGVPVYKPVWRYMMDLPPCACAADVNCSGTLTSQDLFDFLSLYFSNSALADTNSSGDITVQDLFEFLAAWFTGC